MKARLGLVAMQGIALYSRVMDRMVSKTGRMSKQDDDDYVPGSPASRIQLVWVLTREIASLSRLHDVERRLQRDVTVLGRRRR